jgi:phosphoenolpyruvate-protein phosphotransferase
MKEPASHTLQGTPISPGLPEGTIHVHRAVPIPLDIPANAETHDVDDEISRLDSATVNISDDLLALASRVEKEIDSKLAEVFGVHQLILNDRSLQEELRREIAENLVSAGSAVKTVFLRWENRFQLMESQIARDKGDDMRDISNRLCDALAGITIHPLEEIPHGCVLATMRLLPSETVFLHGRSTSAVLLEHGSHGSHAALFAREMGLPCISGLTALVATVPDGVLALVDADEGSVKIRPDEEQRTDFRAKAARKERVNRLAREHARGPALTRKGTLIPVLANVGCQEDTRVAMENGADGVGLYRIEQAYFARLEPPGAEELFEEMHQTLEPAKGKSVCVRLLDIGADKPLPFLKFMAESNPSLGRRGIRLLREYPELLDTQLRTILKLSEEFDIRILVPIVTLPNDMAHVRERLSVLASELRVTSIPELGAMIETPAAALSAGELAAHSDFLSFGTNDLTQYTCAADRENAAVERYFDDTAEAIFRLMQITRDDVPGMPLSLCGELAGRPEHTARLLECGIGTFSVAAPLIPGIKEAIRNA